MKNKRGDVRSRFRRRVFYDIVASAVITCVAEAFLVININMITGFLRQNGYQTSLFNMRNGEILTWIFLYLVIGIAVFSISFLLLQERVVKYIGEISDAMEEISGGNLNVSLEVKGDDEFSQMASSLNRMAEDIRLLMERERESERTKNELITNVAHDLRTPLTSVIGYLELLMAEGVVPEEKRREYVRITYNKAKHLEHLIEDLFGFTKLTYGKISMKVTQVDIVQLLTQLLDEFYPNFSDNDMHYEIHSNSRSIPLNGDGNLLARLFENLIGNAIKYGREGKVVNVYITQKDNIVVISVVNYGYVIPQEELSHIFDKFYRVDQARSSSTGGTGLGLAIAKNIVEMHGGSIEARSDLNGTVFEVRLRTDFDPERENFEVPGGGDRKG
mgnify:CR=1 FL=1